MAVFGRESPLLAFVFQKKWFGNMPGRLSRCFHFRFSSESEKDHEPKNVFFGSFTPLVAARRIDNPAIEAIFTEVKTASIYTAAELESVGDLAWK